MVWFDPLDSTGGEAQPAAPAAASGAELMAGNVPTDARHTH